MLVSEDSSLGEEIGSKGAKPILQHARSRNEVGQKSDHYTLKEDFDAENRILSVLDFPPTLVGSG